ncbi:MAG: TSUP family transporter [Chakrabartia sp.]
MPLATAAFLLAMAFLTAALSGIFGMAGGLVLMGALAFTLPVSAAFVTHGLLQLVANGWRAILHRHHVCWPILLNYAVASAAAAGLITLVTWSPSRPVLFLLLGLVPLLVWLPRDRLRLDAARRPHALASGFLVTSLNLTAGVAGPLLDIFFVRTDLSRHQIVATKAATQVFSHLAKILVYGAPLFWAKGTTGLPPLWLFALAVPLSMAGTMAGGWVLERMSDTDFKRWTAWIVTGIGLVYLAKAADLSL